jgi:hypothetical protein
MSNPALPLCCLTFDVEEYYHIEAAREALGNDAHLRWPSRVESCVERVLALLAGHGRKATFFSSARWRGDTRSWCAASSPTATGSPATA